MIPYTAPLPIRNSSVWGEFAKAEPIPYRWGELAGSAIQYGSDRRLWCWSDGACFRIDAVSVEGQQRQDWSWRNAIDRAGSPVCLIEFGEPPPSGAAVVATGRGRLDSRTGALIDNPADVVRDIVTVICGNTLSAGALDQFRQECAGLPIAGELTGGSVQQAIRSVCDSVGAVFSPLHPGLCQIHPGGQYAGTQHAVTGRYAGTDVNCTAGLDDIANDITISYAHVDGDATASLQLASPASIERFGRRQLAVSLPWVRLPRIAYAVGKRLLQHSARPRWRYSARNIPEVLLAPGDSLAISSGYVPPAVATINRLSLDYRRETTSVELADSWVGPATAVTIVRTSVQFTPPAESAVSVSAAGADHVLTILDDAGRPIPQARVTIDRSILRLADSGGIVRIPQALMPAGQHHLLIEGAGMSALETVVTV